MEQVKYTRNQRYKCKEKTNRVIIALLDEKGLTQAQLADRIGVERAYVNRMIHGTQNVPIFAMIRMAKTLGVDSRTIFPDPGIIEYKRKLGAPRCICHHCTVKKCQNKPPSNP